MQGRGRPLTRREVLRLGATGSALVAAAPLVASCNGSPGPAGTAGQGGHGTGTGGTGAGGGATLPVGSTPPTQAELRQIEHVVIHMQENRSFDCYFGTRNGVRGFHDPGAPVIGSGRSNLYQPDPSRPGGYLLPFRLDSVAGKGQCSPDPDHSWDGQHKAWNGGRNDRFAEVIGSWSMGYFTGDDIPYYYALADRFTLCDQWFCSVLGPTQPNRLYLMTGTIDPTGRAGGPATGGDGTYSWETYPERLEHAGISWRVYHEVDDYDDNVLKYFTRFRGLNPTDPLHEAAIKDRPADEFLEDARSGNLPQVSWIVSPTIPSEHPPFPPAFGELYTSRILSAIWSNPTLWAKTLVIFTYDENGGFFDHVPPPVPAAGTADEFIRGDPIGLGFRVPGMVISPWSRGGRVVSDVFDHTSVLRFLETRFGVEAPLISAWRRQTCGDLTTTLDFSRPGDTSIPTLPDAEVEADRARDRCVTGANVGPSDPQTPP